MDRLLAPLVAFFGLRATPQGCRLPRVAAMLALWIVVLVLVVVVSSLRHRIALSFDFESAAARTSRPRQISRTRNCGAKGDPDGAR
ncbi:MAG TPA: hypothetical protein VKB09_12460, partial [Thermomicrobiales bacterium]|nr:hypothetical protein [Thermomicrobiales bacterium]